LTNDSVRRLASDVAALVRFLTLPQWRRINPLFAVDFPSVAAPRGLEQGSGRVYRVWLPPWCWAPL